MSTDPQAMEMATYDLHAYGRWQDEHCDQAGRLYHTTPIEDCPICRWGCQVAECGCQGTAT